jgi:hypothetical protein
MDKTETTGRPTSKHVRMTAAQADLIARAAEKTGVPPSVRAPDDADYRIVGAWAVTRLLMDNRAPVASMPVSAICSLWLAGLTPEPAIMDKIRAEYDAALRRKGKGWDAIAERERQKAA